MLLLREGAHHGGLQRACEWGVEAGDGGGGVGPAFRVPFVWNEAFAFSTLSVFAAAGRDEEEEGDAHRPGDHELGESVSSPPNTAPTAAPGWNRSLSPSATRPKLVFFFTDLWTS